MENFDYNNRKVIFAKLKNVGFSALQIRQIREVFEEAIQESIERLATKEDLYRMQTKMLYKMMSIFSIIQGILLVLIKFIAY